MWYIWLYRNIHADFLPKAEVISLEAVQDNVDIQSFLLVWQVFLNSNEIMKVYRHLEFFGDTLHILTFFDLPVNLPSVPSIFWQKRLSMCASLTVTLTLSSSVSCHTAEDCLASQSGDCQREGETQESSSQKQERCFTHTVFLSGQIITQGLHHSLPILQVLCTVQPPQ